jgi:hypothetical protein
VTRARAAYLPSKKYSRFAGRHAPQRVRCCTSAYPLARHKAYAATQLSRQRAIAVTHAQWRNPSSSLPNGARAAGGDGASWARLANRT